MVIDRMIYFYIDPETNNEIRRTVRRNLPLRISEIGNSLKPIIRELCNKENKCVTRVVLNTKNNNLTKFNSAEEIFADLGMIRVKQELRGFIEINLLQNKKTDNSDFLKNQEISHIINICFGTSRHNQGFRSTSDEFSVLIEPYAGNDINKFIAETAKLVKLICIDIVTYYMLINNYHIARNVNKNDLSKLKVKYLNEIGKTSTSFGRLQPQAKYVPFSALFDLNTFVEVGVGSYLQLWREFLYWVESQDGLDIMPGPDDSPKLFVPNFVIRSEFDLANLKEVFSSHEQFHQLPMSRLYKEIKLLDSGIYMLLRIKKRPKNKKLKKSLDAIFGSHRIGRIRLLENEMFEKIKHQCRSVSHLIMYFEFVIKERDQVGKL